MPSGSRRDAAAEWLLSRINYERSNVVPYGERQLKLDRMRQFVTALGSPDTAAPIIHIAGTKGKGSTAAMVAAMLTASGCRTGVFSSPHLERLEERFAINGIAATGEQFADLVDTVRPVVDEFDRRADESGEDGLTFFDISTAMALVYFARQQCAAVVLEVGLGGRLDSTNVCLPAVSVITSISFDHTKQLGNSLASIAGEKAGIIKSGVPVVSGVTPAEPREVIAQVAREHGARLIERPRDFDYVYHPSKKGDKFDYVVAGEVKLTDVALALTGEHQAANGAVALAVVDELIRQGWQIPESARREGLATMRLAGRIELVPGEPLVVLDTAHNAASAAALATTLAARCEVPRTLVIACSRDKDFAAIATALVPHFERILITEYQSNPRVVPRDELAAAFRAVADSGGTAAIELFATPTEAWNRALEVTPKQGMIAIAGSFFLAAELRPVVLGERGTPTSS
jgi:dihydrofolate synthase/folylpolyglutamate synthase